MTTRAERPARHAGGVGWQAGWWRGARRIVSPNQGPRPHGAAVTLAVIHSISLPPGQYGGPEVAQLFTNQLDCDAHAYFESLRGVRVSAHFLVRRDGELLQFVSCDRRAWHAGHSSWRGVEDCNDYAVGIELEGLEGDPFEAAQYLALAALLRALARRYPLREAVGHEHVAPGRKGDPGAGFHWDRLRQALRGPIRRSSPAQPKGRARRQRHGPQLAPARCRLRLFGERAGIGPSTSGKS